MRAILRDDGCGYPRVRSGLTVGLDDDSVPTVLDGDIPGPTPLPGSTLPLVSVRDRQANGYDDEGNPQWTWRTLVDGARAVTYTEREERDDRAGTTTVVASVRFLYDWAVDIRETAIARTEDGHTWRVTAVEHFPGQALLTLERTDDGA